ncbi:hypothetical protein CR205_17985 [Alteribacter lacisalsi]|uniref:Uncharacterized protein n=1 Tax=Alteribacter lacisalsi TaxID=2045244 RepID=A0A2W0H342_9BACI|nr:hypothetical protein CR205_17985 [Alteribacter lacisalsi]
MDTLLTVSGRTRAEYKRKSLLKLNIDIFLSLIEANARHLWEQRRLKTPQGALPEEAEAVPAERERSERKTTTDFNRAKKGSETQTGPELFGIFRCETIR